MKKLLALSAVIMAFAATPALAEHHEGKEGPRKGHLFEKADTDGDGKVTKAEFMAAQEEMFTKLDADGDGAFTKEEAEAMKEKWKEKHKEMKEKPADAPAE